MQYVGQTRDSLKTRFIERHRYIKTNDPKSAYALHILHNKYEYCPLQFTMELLKICKKGWKMNTIENFCIQMYYQKGSLRNKQNPGEENPLFKFIIPTTCNTHAFSSIQLPSIQPLHNQSVQITTQDT